MLISHSPSEYIFDPQTLSEARRVLRGGGKFIILPAAFPAYGFLKWLYRVTGEAPAALDETFKGKIRGRFTQAGFSAEVEVLQLESAILLVVLAGK
jgi:ubiquinone/menaquinone biosynthesis C-methylase UbiE